MNRLFHLDNPVLQFFSKVFDLILLNILFIFTCIPILTIGASLTALYSMTLKMVRNQESYIIKGYFKAFASNLKQSTIVWLICLVVMFFIHFDIVFVTGMGKGGILFLMQVFVYVVTLFAIAVFLYLFPVIAHFVCTTKQVFQNALFLSLGHLPYTLVLFAMYGLILFIATRSVRLLSLLVVLSMFCLFSVTAYVGSLMFNRIFRKYVPEESEESSEAEA